MKKVMCINETNIWWNDQTDSVTVGPVYGQPCTVYNIVTENGFLGYLLVGYPDRGPFISSLFIPLTDSSAEIAGEMMEKELAEM